MRLKYVRWRSEISPWITLSKLLVPLGYDVRELGTDSDLSQSWTTQVVTARGMDEIRHQTMQQQHYKFTFKKMPSDIVHLERTIWRNSTNATNLIESILLPCVFSIWYELPHFTHFFLPSMVPWLGYMYQFVELGVNVCPPCGVERETSQLGQGRYWI